MKKLLLLLSLISFQAFSVDRGVPCNSNSCKVKIVTKDSGGTAILQMNGSMTVPLNAGEYVDVRVRQGSGGSLTLHADADYNWVQVLQVG